jgi:hypothetical protein
MQPCSTPGVASLVRLLLPLLLLLLLLLLLELLGLWRRQASPSLTGMGRTYGARQGGGRRKAP